VRAYRSLVKPGNLEPNFDDHLTGGEDQVAIPAGLYLFVQGKPFEGAIMDEISARKDAEALWLEALWRDLAFKNDRILARILSEDGKTVYQLFREIEGTIEEALTAGGSQP
jgi:hypothetical protein